MFTGSKMSLRLTIPSGKGGEGGAHGTRQIRGWGMQGYTLDV